MKTIIVPTDFSPAALNAVNYAADMAIQIKAGLLLVHVYQVPVTVTEGTMLMLSITELQEAAEISMKKLKEKLQHITPATLTINTETVLGDVTDEIERICTKIKPLAVVMGTTGHSAAERLLLGSTTLAVIKQVNSPVICIPKGKEYGNGIQKAGLACDFKEVAETTPANTIKNFIQEFNAHLHIINIDYDNEQTTEETPEQSALLQTSLQELNPVYHFIHNKDVEDGISEFAEKNNLDLVIIIPKKHSLSEKLFKKSTTRNLIFESHIPVMCVHD